MLARTTSVCVALLAGNLPAQTPFIRGWNLLDNCPLPSASIASVADLTVVLYGDGIASGDSIVVRTSDGRGVTWSAPVDIDRTSSSNNRATHPDSVQIVGDTVYGYWRNNLNGSPFSRWDLHFNRSVDRGVTWLPNDVRIDKGTPAGVGTIGDSRFAVSTDASGDHLYFLFAADPDGSSPEELLLVSSHDGGATFGGPVPVSTVHGKGWDVERIGLGADGLDVYAVWADDRHGGAGSDLFYRKSSDGGRRWGVERRIDLSSPGVGEIAAVDVVVRNNELAIGWLETTGRYTPGDFFMAYSTDRGQTLGVARPVGGTRPGVDAVWSMDLGSGLGGISAVWTDDRSGTLAVYASSTYDGGRNWEPVSRLANGQAASISVSEGTEILGVSYDRLGVYGSYSLDDGKTWQAAFNVYGPGCPRWPTTFAYNALYNNFLHLWYDAPGCGTDELSVGGYRLQQVTPVGWTAGPTAIHFDLSGFAPGQNLAIVLGSFSLGNVSLPFAGGRSFGLTLDPFMQFALSNPALFTAPLGQNGTGSTVSVPVALPPGLLVYFAAAAFDFSSGFGDITDVRQVYVR